MEEWKPERKIVAAAIAGLLLWLAQLALPEIQIPPGMEAGIAVIVGYFVPNPK